MNHGVYASEQATVENGTPIVSESGIPFVVGVAPIQAAESAASVGVPVLCESLTDFKEKFGYTDDFDKYGLCEFAYAHFVLFGCQPAIFVNVMDVTKATHKESVTETAYTVTNHKAKLPIEAINNTSLVVKNGSTTLTKGTDYAVGYDESNCIVELLEDGTAYSAASLNIAYAKAKPAGVTASEVVTAIEAVELCVTTVGSIPDLLCAPGFSSTATVAAAMATKAENINGLFKAKAIVDIDASANVNTPALAIAKKATDGMDEASEIVCWPMAKKDGKKYHVSTLVAGAIAAKDTSNNGIPYESMSNTAAHCDALCLSDGTEINVTLAQGNTLNAAGIVTVLNFINGWVLWGNYTGCFPTEDDVKDKFIPVSRMFGWVGNTLVRTFWEKLDRAMNRLLIDSILDATNIWLNGLTGSGYILGGRVVMLDSENPLENLVAGKIKYHIYITPPSPAQEIDFVSEYDQSYVQSALGNE